MTASLSDIEEIARETISGLPAQFRSHAEQVALQVVDWPTAEMIRDFDLADPADLTGLYEGIPLTEKSVFDPAPLPDMIWLFREPILAEHRTRGNVTLAALVAHVTIHELAHHFGWSDSDIATIDRWWE